MSSDASASVSPTPTTRAEQLRLEALERLTESIPPAMGLSRLVATDHMNKMLAASRRRVEDDHKRQALQLQQITGVEFELAEDTEDDEVAISVTGDTTHNYTAPASNASTLAKAAGVAGLTGLAALAGVGAYKVIDDNDNPQPPPAIVAPAEPGRDTSLTYDFGIE